MLKFVRKRRRSVFIIFAFFAIIVVFIFWGVGPRAKRSPENTVVAMVDGVKISAKDYNDFYQRQLDYYRNTFRDQFSEDMIRRLNLRRKAIDTLINRTLVLNAARRDGVDVTDSEVQRAIMDMKEFQRNGSFDKKLYFTLLSRNRIKPRDFEDSIRTDLIIEKMKNKVVGDITVTDEEVRKVYDKENREVSFDYVTIDPASFEKDVTVTDEEAEKFFESKKREFFVPVKIKAFYVRVSPEDFLSDVKPTDEELKTYYEKNIIEFQMPRQVRARHILIRPDTRGRSLEEAKKEAKKKAGELLERIKKGEDFSKLAKQYSDDKGSAKEGGDLGWFSRGIMVKPFEDAAFSLKKGEVSPIVETEFGYHIIKVEDIREERLQPFNEAKERIREIIKKEKAGELARKKAEEVQKKIKEAKTEEELDAIASDKKLKAVTTDLFSENDRKVELAKDPELRDTAFFLKEGATSGVIDTDAGFYVIKVLKKVDAHVPAYEEVAEEVKKRLKKEKAKELAKEKAKEIVEKVKGGEDLLEVAQKEGLPVAKTDFFRMVDGFIPGIGVFVGDREELFKLKKDDPFFHKPIEYNDKLYLLKLREAKEADPEGFEKEKKEIKRRLLAQKKDDAVSAWIKELKSKAEIEVNEELL